MNGSYSEDMITTDSSGVETTSATKTIEWQATKLPFENALELKVDFYYTNYSTDELGTSCKGWVNKWYQQNTITGYYQEGVDTTGAGESVDYYWGEIGVKTLVKSSTFKVPYKVDGVMEPIHIKCGTYNDLVDGTDSLDYYSIYKMVEIPDLHSINIRKPGASVPFHPCNPFVKVAGVWKRCIAYKKVNGVWKKSTD